MRTRVPDSLYIPAPRLNQLNILTWLASNPNLTQAELARRCALSAAMINNYMKEFYRSGLVEYHRNNSKRITYRLTLAGGELLDATRREFIQEMVKLFAQAKERIREFILNQAPGVLRRVILYGNGDLAELVFHALESAEVNVIGICVDDPGAIGREWCGRQMLSPSQIRYLVPDSVVIADTQRADEIQRSLRYLLDRGIRLIRICGTVTEMPQ